MFQLNEGQRYIVEEAVKWFYNSHEQVFQYDGPPGSGKSVVLMEIIRRLGLDIMTEVAPMSFIGSASLVMRMKGLLSAKTIHSWLYTVKELNALDENGNVIMDTLLNKPIKVPKFVPVIALDPKIKLLVVDEAFREIWIKDISVRRPSTIASSRRCSSILSIWKDISSYRGYETDRKR